MANNAENTTERAILRNLKVIGDNEFTLLGTPADLIQEIRQGVVQEVQAIGDRVPPNLILNEITNQFYEPVSQQEQTNGE